MTLASSEDGVHEQCVVKLLWWFSETVKRNLINLVLEDEMWDRESSLYLLVVAHIVWVF